MLVLKVLEFVASLRAGDYRKAGRVLAEILGLVFAENQAATETDPAKLASAIAEADAVLAGAAIGDGALLAKLLELWSIIKLFLCHPVPVRGPGARVPS